PPRRVRLDLTRPPVFFQLGHSPSQLQNFFTVANRDTPGPISLITVNAVSSLTLSISVKSSPTTLYSAARTSKPGELARRFGRAFGFSGGKARSHFIRPNWRAFRSTRSPWNRPVS